MEKNFLSPIDLCQRAQGISLIRVYQLLYAGRIKAEKRAGRWQIPETEAERFLAERKARLQAGAGGDSE